MRLRLSKGYRETRISGILTVGSVVSGGFLALNKSGERLLELIRKEEEIDETVLSENLKELIIAGKEIGIFLDAKETEKAVDSGEIESAYFHVTNHCNLHCKGCYSDVNERNRRKDMEELEIRIALTKLRRAGCTKIIISGGEPFLRKDIVDIVRYARVDLKFETIILATNGTIHDRELIEGVLKYIDILSISIDGISETECDYIRDVGTFAKVDRFIDIVKSISGNIRLLPTIHRYNYKRLYEYVEYAERKGIQLGFSLLTCNKDNLDLADFVLSTEEMVEFVKGEDNVQLSMIEDVSFNIDSLCFKTSCGAGKSMISVAADGNVYPCHMLQDNRYRLGNILEEDVETILNSSMAKDIRKIDVDDNVYCQECTYKYFCGGGCAARRVFQKERTVDMYCEAYKANYQKIDSFFNGLSQ